MKYQHGLTPLSVSAIAALFLLWPGSQSFAAEPKDPGAGPCDSADGAVAFREKILKGFLKQLKEAADGKKHLMDAKELIAGLNKDVLKQLGTNAEALTLASEARQKFLDLDGAYVKSRETLAKYLARTFADLSEESGEIPESKDEVYERLAKRLKVSVPTLRSYLNEEGLFGGIDSLIDYAKIVDRAAFAMVTDKRIFNNVREKKLIEVLGKAEHIAVVHLIEGTKLPMERFLAAKQLAKDYRAPLIFIPPYNNLEGVLEEHSFLFEDPQVHFLLHENTFLDVQNRIVNAQKMDSNDNPFSGLKDGIYPPGSRVIVANRKAMLEVRPSATNGAESTIFVTTGSLSENTFVRKYAANQGQDYIQSLKGWPSMLILSRNAIDWQMQDLIGGTPGISFSRATWALPKYGNPGGLYFNGKIYYGAKHDEAGSVIKPGGSIRPGHLAGLVLGDFHYPKTNPVFLKATVELLLHHKVIERVPNPAPGQLPYRPGKVGLGTIVLHDATDGAGLSDWIKGAIATTYKQTKSGDLDVVAELEGTAAMIMHLKMLLPNTTVVIPVDNHGHDRLKRSIEKALATATGAEGHFVMLLRLLLDTITRGGNIYQTAFEYVGLDMKNVMFLDKDEQMRVGYDPDTRRVGSMVDGTVEGTHGDKAVGGGRSGISIRQMLESYWANMAGHIHRIAQYGRGFNVGTGTDKVQDYHDGGPGAGSSGAGTIYDDYAMQLYELRRGHFIAPSLPADRRAVPEDDPYPYFQDREAPIGEQSSVLDQAKNMKLRKGK